jgi:two-component system sensor kinase FixL
MSAEFAHELNQSLSSIMSYIQATKRTLDAIEGFPVARVSELMSRAAKETLRAGAIVRNLRWLRRDGARERTVEDLNKLIEESATLALGGEANIRVHFHLDPNLAPLVIDKAQIQQVLTHLIRNGVEAMTGADRRELTLSTRIDDEGFAEVCVSDTGAGLSAKVLDRLFQPFVTTKDKKMGIGLTISKSIVESHGGTIWAIRQQPEGTGLVFRLPRDEESEAVR